MLFWSFFSMSSSEAKLREGVGGGVEEGGLAPTAAAAPTMRPRAGK